MRGAPPDASIWCCSEQFGEALLSRFTDFIDTQRKLQTLDQLLKHVEVAPADPRVRLRLGDVLQGLDRIDEAIAQYREAAVLLARRGFDKQAKAVRALILRLAPQDAGAVRDVAFENDVELARTQEPLPREEKVLTEDGELVHAEGPDIIVTAGGSAQRSPAAPAGGPPPPSAATKALPAAPWDSPAANFLARDLGTGDTDGITVDVDTNAQAQARATVDDDGAAPGMPPRPRDRRGDPRAHADGVVRLHGNGVGSTGFLEDVSLTGLFVAGPRPYPIGTIVDLALQLPQAAWIGLARARVMRSVEASRRRPAGLGLALLWTDPPTERWIEDFVTTVFGAAAVTRRARYPDGEKRSEDIRRQHPRGAIDLPAVIRAPEFDVTGWVRDVSMGGAFVDGPRVFGPGRRVELLLWLPQSYTPLVIDAVVAHDNRPPSNGHGAGTGLRFIRVGDALAAELQKLFSAPA
ncbi:MAG TPA: PilZ domain-containing protein [bacterium]|nr:PilZ domain-containing protein [bacterium]